MKTKRNIAICLGSLLILMGMFASTAAAEEITLGLSVSPENLVIGTNAKWTSVVFHVEDYNADYKAGDINPGSITLTITDSAGNSKPITAGEYDRSEITDADGDGLEELVLIYLASDLLDTDYLTLDGKGLQFEAAGSVGEEDTFRASGFAKTMMIGDKAGEKSKRPADKGSGGNGPGSGGSGGNGPGSGGSGGKGK
jgi:uncharacterized membrane protein YgcG